VSKINIFSEITIASIEKHFNI